MPIDVIDYSNTVFYKIYCNDANIKDLYVGHTTNFVQRKYAHKRSCVKEIDANHNLKLYKCIREHGGWDNWKMDIIGFQDCYDHYEVRKKEQNYFETLQATLNSLEPLPKPKKRPNEKQEKTVFNCDVCKTTCLTNKAFIAHEETKKHKRNVVANAPANETQEERMIKSSKNTETFVCRKCDFKCSKQSGYDSHLLTAKHNLEIMVNVVTPNGAKPCISETEYNHNQSYSIHKNDCSLNSKSSVEQENPEEEPSMMDVIMRNKEIMDMLVLQNKELQRQNKEQSDRIRELIPNIGL